MSHETGAATLRIGIWCDYGFTLTPHAGIGVFVYNLIAGLLEIEEPIEIALLVRPGDHDIVAELKQRSPEEVSVVPWVLDFPPKRPTVASRWLSITDAVRTAQRKTKEKLLQGKHNLICRIKPTAAIVLSDARKGRRTAMAICGAAILITPVLFVASWFFFAFYKLLAVIYRIAFFPIRVLDTLAAQHIEREQATRENIRNRNPQDYDPMATVRAAGCDVWFFPYYGIDAEIKVPSVLAIHDLVYEHHPESLPGHVCSVLRRIVPQRSREATLCACMSAYIRDLDLLGVLQLPRHKVRMIRPAAPTDFPEVSDAECKELLPKHLTRPYLLFPAEFRPYKNHAALVEALKVLHLRGEGWLDLVFTGGNSPVPPDLQQTIESAGLKERVHILGRVDRTVLAALYKHAFATMVPSFYEQGSFPIYEALHWGCPVACSRIAPLLEQCESMGDAMLYFDPRDVTSMTETVLKIRDDWDGIQERQAVAKNTLWKRTWKDVAKEWLEVFREAVEISNARWSHKAIINAENYTGT